MYTALQLTHYIFSSILMVMADQSENNLFRYPSPVLPVPLYQVVRDRLLLELYRSAYPPGHILGTEDDLCRQHQVSRKTIRHAISELEIAGFLQRRQKVGVIVTEKNLPSPVPRTGFHRVILLLPSWSYSTGNWMERGVARHLGGIPQPPDWEFSVEIRSFHEPLPETDDQLYAIIAADPSQHHYAALERLAARGVRIITIEPQISLHMAINIYPDVYQAASEAINHFYMHGHRRIGLLSHPCEHYSFQLWLDGFIQAMTEQNLSILPHAILDNRGLAKCSAQQFSRISAWLCITQSNVTELFARLKTQGLSVPGDVSIIGSDDPYGDGLFGQEVPVSVFSPDVKKLVRLLRRLLQMEDENAAAPGATLFYSMLPVHRASVAKCRS